MVRNGNRFKGLKLTKSNEINNGMKTKKKHTIVLMHGKKEITRFESHSIPPATILVKPSSFVGGNSFSFTKMRTRSYVHTYQSGDYLNYLEAKRKEKNNESR